MGLWFWFGTSLVISSIDFEYVVSAVVFRRVMVIVYNAPSDNAGNYATIRGTPIRTLNWTLKPQSNLKGMGYFAPIHALLQHTGNIFHLVQE